MHNVQREQTYYTAAVEIGLVLEKLYRNVKERPKNLDQNHRSQCEMEPPEPGGGAFTPIRDSNLSQIEERGDILVTNFCAAVDGVLDTNASKAIVVKISSHPQVFCSQDKKKIKTIIAVGRKDTASFAIIEDFTLVNPCALPLSIQLLLWTEE